MVNLFIRQPFSESGPQEKQVVQSVLDLIGELIAERPDINIIRRRRPTALCRVLRS